jgi:ribosomal protein S18 acetylase RimI-like enzyme
LHAHVRTLAAADPAVCGLRLYVEAENRGARATYEALGMRKTPYRIYDETL